MKILMVSMPSLHFYRWVNQLKDTQHEIHWFDVTGSGVKADAINWVTQTTNWKLRYDFKGRSFIKKKTPGLYKVIQSINERGLATSFEKELIKFNPDVVHSFALYVSCAPILEVMKRHRKTKWVYSSWGSDLFYFQNKPNYLIDIKNVLPEVDFMFSDCHRDFEIAKKHGFKGDFLGVFPGGGGYHLEKMKRWFLPLEQRDTILIKGYQGRSGRAITVLKAIEDLKRQLGSYNIVVFGANEEVLSYLNTSNLVNWNNFKAFGNIPHDKVIELMGASLIYIGNSNSDGIPNTLLEAIILGAFPIQSNPGNATEEVIELNKNGLLIENCEDINHIRDVIKEAVTNEQLIERGFELNKNKVAQKYDYDANKTNVLKAYNSVIKK